MARKKVTVLTDNDRDLLKAKSPLGLPDNPSSKGFTSAQIKAKFAECVLQLAHFLKITQTETNESIDEVYGELAKRVNTSEGASKIKYITTADGNEGIQFIVDEKTSMTIYKDRIDFVINDKPVMTLDGNSIKITTDSLEVSNSIKAAQFILNGKNVAASSNDDSRLYILQLNNAEWVRIAKVSDITRHASGVFTVTVDGILGDGTRCPLTTSVFSVSAFIDENTEIKSDILPITQTPEIQTNGASNGGSSADGSGGGSGDSGSGGSGYSIPVFSKTISVDFSTGYTDGELLENIIGEDYEITSDSSMAITTDENGTTKLILNPTQTFTIKITGQGYISKFAFKDSLANVEGGDLLKHVAKNEDGEIVDEGALNPTYNGVFSFDDTEPIEIEFTNIGSAPIYIGSFSCLHVCNDTLANIPEYMIGSSNTMFGMHSIRMGRYNTKELYLEGLFSYPSTDIFAAFEVRIKKQNDFNFEYIKELEISNENHTDSWTWTDNCPTYSTFSYEKILIKKQFTLSELIALINFAKEANTEKYWGWRFSIEGDGSDTILKKIFGFTSDKITLGDSTVELDEYNNFLFDHPENFGKWIKIPYKGNSPSARGIFNKVIGTNCWNKLAKNKVFPVMSEISFNIRIKYSPELYKYNPFIFAIQNPETAAEDGYLYYDVKYCNPDQQIYTLEDILEKYGTNGLYIPEYFEVCVQLEHNVVNLFFGLTLDENYRYCHGISSNFSYDESGVTRPWEGYESSTKFGLYYKSYYSTSSKSVNLISTDKLIETLEDDIYELKNKINNLIDENDEQLELIESLRAQVDFLSAYRTLPLTDTVYYGDFIIKKIVYGISQSELENISSAQELYDLGLISYPGFPLDDFTNGTYYLILASNIDSNTYHLDVMSFEMKGLSWVSNIGGSVSNWQFLGAANKFFFKGSNVYYFASDTTSLDLSNETIWVKDVIQTLITPTNIEENDAIYSFTKFEYFPEEGDEDRLYIDTSINKLYRWNGSKYVPFDSAEPISHDEILAIVGEEE